MNPLKSLRKSLRRSTLLQRLREDIETRKILKKRLRVYPEFQWNQGARCPIKRVEPTCVQVGQKLYLFGSYITLSEVAKRIDVYDMETNRWEYLGDMPDDAPQTHNGAVYDGEGHIYFVSGQTGPFCSPASANCYSFNLSNLSWRKIPSLPLPRYAPLVHYHKGRIHCLSGNDIDRVSRTHDHWSIAVQDGDATEPHWRVDHPLPNARAHTASMLLGDEMHVFGGQYGDYPRLDESPPYRCDFDKPFNFMMKESYAFHLETGELRPLSPTPETISHNENSTLLHQNKVIVVGGIFDGKTISDLICCYDIRKDEWSIIGRTPFPLKTAAGIWKNRIYLVCGQRSVSETDLRPGKVLDTVWYADLPKSLQ